MLSTSSTDALNWPDIFSESTGVSFTQSKWAALIGIDIAVVDFVWSLLPKPSNLHPRYLLYAISHLWVYSTPELAGITWRVSEKTFRTHVKEVLQLLDNNLNFISLNNRFHDPSNYNSYLVIDGKLCPIWVDRKSWHYQKHFFSVKHATHGLKYEIAVHWLTGQIHWIAGGVYGSIHDLTLARRSGILEKLLPEETILADKGYIGEPQILCPFKGKYHQLSEQQRNWNHSIGSKRVIVENVLARLSMFSILSIPYRGKNISRHFSIFNICAQLTQLNLFIHPVRAEHLAELLQLFLNTEDQDDDEDDSNANNDVNFGSVPFRG